jgi:type IV pilus assembly protein PilA
MTPNNPEPPKKSNNLLVGFLVGCGCLSIGVVALGVIAAISLPSFLNQTNRAQVPEASPTFISPEATFIVVAILRSQQAHFIDKGRFAISISEIDAQISGKDYNFKTMRAVNGVGAVVIATPKEPKPVMRGVVGVIYTDKAGSKYTFQICVSEQLSPKPPTPPKPPAVAGGIVACPPGSKANPME